MKTFDVWWSYDILIAYQKALRCVKKHDGKNALDDNVTMSMIMI